MALSNKFGSLVLATGNKSEYAVGYATLYGDMAGGFAPIKDVPKTLVYELCRLAERAGRARRAPPIPDADDDEAAVRRAPARPEGHGLAAAVRRARPDHRGLRRGRPADVDAIVARGFDRATVERVARMIDRAEYKRRQAAPGVKITPKAFGRDRRLPITNRYRRAPVRDRRRKVPARPLVGGQMRCGGAAAARTGGDLRHVRPGAATACRRRPELGVPDALLDAVEANPRKAERGRSPRCSRPGTAPRSARSAARGSTGSRRSRRTSASACCSPGPTAGCDSGAPPSRRCGRPCGAGVHAAGRRRVQPALGRRRLPGTAGPAGVAAAARRDGTTPDGETSVDCDVCVVGSGAGGGTAAAVLAAAGLDVVVLEAGEHLEEADFDGSEATAFRRMYAGQAAAATEDQSVGFSPGVAWAAGRSSTTRRRSARPTRCAPSGRARRDVVRLAGVRREPGRGVASGSRSTSTTTAPSSREVSCARGLEALGWHVEAMPRNVVGCDQGVVCGSCGLGCRLGAKRRRSGRGSPTRRRRRPHPGANAGRARADPRRPRDRRRGPDARRPRGARAGPRRRRRVRIAADAGAAAALGGVERPCRAPPAPAPGDGRVRRVRRGASGRGRGRCRRSTPTSCATCTTGTA